MHICRGIHVADYVSGNSVQLNSGFGLGYFFHFLIFFYFKLFFEIKKNFLGLGVVGFIHFFVSHGRYRRLPTSGVSPLFSRHVMSPMYERTPLNETSSTFPSILHFIICIEPYSPIQHKTHTNISRLASYSIYYI